jgi:hypothetical protein
MTTVHLVDDTDVQHLQKGTTDGAGHVYQAYRQAGERAEDSTVGADHVAVAAEGMVRSVAFGAGDTVLWDGPALLFGWRITTALSAHAWTIDDGATARMTIPASAAVGINTLPCAVIFETSLVANVGTSASAGVIEFFFRPLPANVTWAY